MGRLFDEFGSLSFRNEAEVSQNFIQPLLQRHLGYDSLEIIPERHYPARDIYSGVKFSEGGSKSLNHRPDFIICLNGDLNNPKFIIDSKGPDEGIDDHIGQLRSYAISVGRNLLMMTNGKELKVYDVNNLIFHSKNIEELQLRIKYLSDLLGHDNQVLKSPSDIIKDFDYKNAIGASDQAILDREIQWKKMLLVDFHDYLQRICADLSNWHLPTRHFQALSNLKLNKIDPNYLLSFRQHTTELDPLGRQKSIKLPEIETDRALNIKIFVGETGSGKSCLLKFLTYRAAQNCLDYREIRIPVFISLREIGNGYKLKDLIVAYLNRNGYRCLSFYDLPQTNDFIFYLDAYDEIGEQFLSETSREIEYLSAKYECYLTTRPNRLPQFRPSAIFDVLPISELQVKMVIRWHIDNQNYEFQRQLENNNLRVESSNILLLLFLISLFKESGSLPATVTQVIRAIVERVKKWQDSKSQQGNQMKWEAVEQFLSVLAYRLVESGEAALSKAEAEPHLLNKLLQLEQARKIPGGLTTVQAMDGLAETGLLIVNDDHLYFWHRLFLNYFAAFGLKAKYVDDPTLISALAQDERWNVPIIGLAALLPSITGIVKALKDDLWLSAYCLAENNHCDTREIRQVIDELVTQLNSLVPDIRRKAGNYLASIDHDNARQFFFDAVDSNYSSDVRMHALSVIGKTGSAEARALIYRYIDWDEIAYLLGPSSQAHIARALFYFGEEEHLQIVKNWEKTPNYQMAEECKNIFIELQSQQKLTPKLIEALQQLFIAEYKKEQYGLEKLNAIAKILALLPDDRFAAQVIEFPFIYKELSKVDGIYELLKDYRSMHVIGLVKDKILERADCNYVIEMLVEIITDSACDVPKEIFYALTLHPNSNVASKAIGALKRFPYNEVKEEVERHLYGDRPQLQSWALGILVDNGEVVHLVRSQQFPIHFYSSAAHTLLKAVRRFHLTEALPLMEKIFNALADPKRYDYDIHLILDLAGSYYFIGEQNRHAEIIAWFFDGNKFIQRSGNIHFHLMKNLKYFSPSLSLQVSECYFRTYFPFRGDHEIRFKMQVFLETIEELAQKALSPYVKKIVEMLLAEAKEANNIARLELERPMRTLVSLAQPSDEEWILARLDEIKYNDGFEFPQLRRAAECLAFAGSAKSLPYLKQIAAQFKHSEMVLNVCQFAYEQICRREKISFTAGDLFQA